jgi:hypothetical protein
MLPDLRRGDHAMFPEAGPLWSRPVASWITLAGGGIPIPIPSEKNWVTALINPRAS